MGVNLVTPPTDSSGKYDYESLPLPTYSWALRSVGARKHGRELRAEAGRILQLLLDHRWIEVLRVRRGTGAEVSLDSQAAWASLADPSAYDAPEMNEWFIGFSATEEGKSALREQILRRK